MNINKEFEKYLLTASCCQECGSPMDSEETYTAGVKMVLEKSKSHISNRLKIVGGEGEKYQLNMLIHEIDTELDK